MNVRILLVAVVGCSGSKAKVKPPVAKPDNKLQAPEAESEDQRETKRRAAAHAIVPEAATCFPAALKAYGAPKLELAAVGTDAVICATDVDEARLLGPIACWKVDLAEGGLVYQAANPLPGRSIAVKLDDRCARGYCVPKDAKLPANQLAYMTTNDDGSKVVLLAGDELHVFDATARSRESGFSIRGDKGAVGEATAVHWVGGGLFVETKPETGGGTHVYVFKIDGTGQGAIHTLGGKETPISTNGGSFVILDKTRIGIVERGFSSVTTYEVDSGKRAKIVRNVSNGPCKKPEADAYWGEGSAEIGQKCKEHMTKTFGHLIGADAVAGKTNLLALLRGPRLGELAVLDVRNLSEKKLIKLPWCDGPK